MTRSLKVGAGHARTSSTNVFSGTQEFLNGFAIGETTTGAMGVVTLVAGTATVANTRVTATSRIFLSVQELGTVSVATAVAVTARTAGVSFVITSAGGTDTSVVAWLLVDPIDPGGSYTNPRDLEEALASDAVAHPASITE